MNESTSPNWESLLVAYLSGNCDLTALYEAAKVPLERVVGRIAPSMPVDVREEVVQQVFVRLLENPPTYDATKCTLRTFAYGLLRNAVRHVRALYAPPGERTRFTSEPEQNTQQAARAILSHPEDLVADRVEVAVNLEEVRATRWTADTIQAYAHAHELLAKMTDNARAAAWLIHGLGHTILEAAALLRKSRFAVARSLNQVRSIRPQNGRSGVERLYQGGSHDRR